MSKDSLLAGGEQTYNNTGYMTGSLDPYSKKFIEYAAKIKGKVLDIGACFGVAVIPALKKGAMVIASDIDPRHLEELESRVDENCLDRLTCVTGSLPDNLDIDNESINAILCCRVLHLLKADEIERSLENMYRWLKPGGKLFLVNDTPYAKYSEKMINEFSVIFEKEKAKGNKWPGWVANLKHYLDPVFHHISPEYVMLIDPDTMKSACERAGFTVEKSEYIPRPDYPEKLQYDGRENSGVIAVKTVK